MTVLQAIGLFLVLARRRVRVGRQRLMRAVTLALRVDGGFLA